MLLAQLYIFFSMIHHQPKSTLFPYTTLFRSVAALQPRIRAEMSPDPHAIERGGRSEEHTSELQSRENLVCRLLLEKKKRLQNCRFSRVSKSCIQDRSTVRLSKEQNREDNNQP